MPKKQNRRERQNQELNEWLANSAGLTSAPITPTTSATPFKYNPQKHNWYTRHGFTNIDGIWINEKTGEVVYEESLSHKPHERVERPATDRVRKLVEQKKQDEWDRYGEDPPF